MAKPKKTVSPVEVVERIAEVVPEPLEVNLADLVLPEGEILPEPEDKKIPCYTSDFFHTNPYSLLRFGPGMKTPVEEIDSWMSSQIEAKIIRLVE